MVMIQRTWWKSDKSSTLISTITFDLPPIGLKYIGVRQRVNT